MSRTTTALSIAALTAGLSSSAFAQITIDDSGFGTLTAENYVHVLTGPENGLQTWAESYTGAGVAIGTFSGGASVFGPFMDSGLILSSGDVFIDTGPLNNSTGAGAVNSTPGDPDLDALTGGFGSTYDAAVLEFEFSCLDLQEISFLFVFASEEYNEYVGSPFNDVFGFYLDGVNVALVPVTIPVPVAINNVNNGGGFTGGFGVGATNPGFYRNNVPFELPTEGLSIQMDGMTILMAVDVPLAGAPGSPHTMKLAIADTSDYILDSAVFIASNTFNCGDPLVVELDHWRGQMRTNGDVLLSWATLSEIDNAGFNIYRQPYSERPLIGPAPGSVLVNPTAMIPAQGTPFAATSYRWMDRSAERGQAYLYWLEDIDLNGRSTLHGPIIVR